MRGTRTSDAARRRGVRPQELAVHSRLRPALATAAAVLLLWPAAGLAQPRTNPPLTHHVEGPPDGKAPPKSPQEQQDGRVFGQLARAWSAFYGGKHEEALKLADPLTKSADPRYRWVAAEAAHLQARSCWAAGTKPSQAKARQIWAQLEKLSPSPATRTRLEIAKALALEAEAQAPNAKPENAAAKVKAAIDLLEPLLQARRWDIATVEAALDASRLYVAAKRFDDARKTLDYIISYLGVERNIIVMEIPPVLVEPYVKAAQDALKRLKYDRDAGREEFEAAERLRRQSKFAEALRAYAAIAKDFADTDYGPRAELHIGDGLIGLRRQPEAIAHWRKFVETKPAGSYRAQALVALIDVFLEEQLNLPDAARYGELARATLPTALADEKAGPSWKVCEYDVAIRIGLVSLVTGKSDDAVAAFTRAKAITDKKTVAESLDALIAAAKSGKGVIPDDVKGSGAVGAATASPSDKVALALSMGIIHLVASRLDNADAFFDRVLGTPAVAAKPGTPGQPTRPAMQGATPAQMAFATFGRGAVLHARRKEADAKEAFLASIKVFNSGTWHDESLYRVASITQDAATSKFAKAPEPAAKPGQPAKPLTPQEREAAAKAEKERLAAFLKAKGEALPYWQELITRYPKSPRVEQAMYNAGVLLCELAEAAPAAQTEKAWKDAAFMLNRFCEFYPKSPMAGDALLVQLDIAIERLFSLQLAESLADAGMEWIRTWENAATRPESRDSWGVWQPPPPAPQDSAIKSTAYELRLRAIFAAYLAEKHDKAKLLLAAAGPLEPTDGRVDTEKLQRIGLHFLQKAILSKTPVWKPEAVEAGRTDQQKTAIKLADLYLRVGRPDKSVVIYERLLHDDLAAPSPPTSLRVYACIQLARAYSYAPTTRDAAIEILKGLYSPEFAKDPGTPEAIVWLGTMVYNHTQDPRKSMPHYEHVIKNYPNSPFAERAMYFYCLDAAAARDSALTEQACKAFLAKYPASIWRKHVQQVLDTTIQGNKQDRKERV